MSVASVDMLGLAAILTPVAVIVGHVLARSDRRRKAQAIEHKTNEIHDLVNARLTAALDALSLALHRIGRLEQAFNLDPGEEPPPNRQRRKDHP